MILKYLYDDHLAQASYLVGCAATGEALVIDPAREIGPYLALAERENLRIRHVAETHIHADFVSGSRELAAHTGATIYLSDLGDADWKYAYAGQPNVVLLNDGHTWMVGNVRIDVVHTPGHTPEHIAFLLTDTAGADRPMGLFTGDFLFVGDVGRPDLLETAAGFAGTSEPGARQQFQTIQRIRQLPDYLQVWPAHGAGSACGKALGSVPSTTLGYEKLFNPAFQFDDEDAFVQWLLAGQPEAPWYFARMKYVNTIGPALLHDLAPPRQIGRAGIDAALQAGELVIDFRPREQFAAAHIPGTVSIPATDRQFNTYVGWLVDDHRPLYMIIGADDACAGILSALRAIGVDHVPGYATAEVVGGHTTFLPTIDVAGLAAMRDRTVILDVRGKNEYAETHLPEALHIPFGFLARQLDQIPRDRPVVIHCASGYRAQIAASLLRRLGYDNVMSLHDTTGQWRELVA